MGEYSIDGARLTMKAQGQTLFYHYGPRGDVVAMTNADAWGNILKSDTKVSQPTIHLDMRDTCMIKRLACII
ncbi:hypothetical protein P4U30_27125 [Bacillus mycoides]|nr:hypothetical protein [Bacillus mycoides]MED1383877.1 hypothetical protein [Bacillus mycoides]